MTALVAAILLLHHSFAADFDTARHITLAGRVTKVEWLNPHAHIYLDVAGEEWSVELGSPNGLRQRGWTRQSVRVGDTVTIDGSRAKDGRRLANASVVILPSGVRLATGSGEGKTS
mgnify:CR=1 FL=1